MRKYVDFQKNELGMSAPDINKSDLEKTLSAFPAAIVGSDQVWNFDLPIVDNSYLLDFSTPLKKYSYAASFEKDELDPERLPEMAKCLKDFKCLTVREDSGIKLCRKLGIENVRTMPDPTLLLITEEWEAIAESPKVKGNIFSFTSASLRKRFPTPRPLFPKKRICR